MTSLTKLIAVAFLVGLASANPVLEARQEAARFGAVSISPSSVPLGGQFTVFYNSTLARWQPKYLDIYLQGVYQNGFVTPDYVLERGSYGDDQQTFTLQTTLPTLDNDSTDGYVAGGSYSIIAEITYETDTGVLAMGGIGTPISIELD